MFVIFLNLVYIYNFDICKKRGSGLAYNSLLLIAVLVAGCRYKLGGDSFGYERMFENIMPNISQLIGDSSKYEAIALFSPSWVVFNAISKSICDNILLFQILHAFIINFVYFSFVKKHSKHKFSAILFYFIFFYLYLNIEIQREALAICCFLMGVEYLVEKRFLRYYFFSLMAFSFHSSAIILMIFPFFRFIKITMPFLLCLFLTIIFIFEYGVDILNLFLISDLIEKKFNIYKNIDSNFNGKILGLITYFIFPYVIFYINDKILKRENVFWKKQYLILYFIAAIFIGNSSIGSRFNNYMKPMFFIVIVDFIYNILHTDFFVRIKVIAVSLFLVIVSFLYLPAYFQDTSYILPNSRYYIFWYPYTNVFTKDEFVQRELFLEYFLSYTRSQHDNTDK